MLTTTPVCQISNGMESATTIPSSQITVNDIQGDVENLRSISETPFVSSVDTLVVQYTPLKTVPVKEVKLTFVENIKSYTVVFYNDDNTVTTRQVRTNFYS